MYNHVWSSITTRNSNVLYVSHEIIKQYPIESLKELVQRHDHQLCVGRPTGSAIEKWCRHSSTHNSKINVI